MIIKNITVGFVVAVFLLLVSTAIMLLTPTGASSMTQVCQSNQTQCLAPQTLSVASSQGW